MVTSLILCSRCTQHSVADREPVPLSIHHLPLCVTFAVFGDGFVLAARARGQFVWCAGWRLTPYAMCAHLGMGSDQVVVDPWFKEEQSLNGRVTLIHNQVRFLPRHALPLSRPDLQSR